MAHYFFVKDLEEGKAAEKFVAEHLKKSYAKSSLQEWKVEELPRERQIEGDLECSVIGGNIKDTFTVEVKFDKMAAKTNNLCFEMANKKGKLTGIASTQADTVVYIVPGKDEVVTLYWFNTEELRAYLYDKKNISKIRQVKGGDRRAYTLLLLSAENIIKDKVAFSVEKVNAELPV